MGSDSGAGYYYFGDGIYAIYPSLDVVQVLTKVTFDQVMCSYFPPLFETVDAYALEFIALLNSGQDELIVIPLVNGDWSCFAYDQNTGAWATVPSGCYDNDLQLTLFCVEAELPEVDQLFMREIYENYFTTPNFPVVTMTADASFKFIQVPNDVNAYGYVPGGRIMKLAPELRLHKASCENFLNLTSTEVGLELLNALDIEVKQPEVKRVALSDLNNAWMCYKIGQTDAWEVVDPCPIYNFHYFFCDVTVAEPYQTQISIFLKSL